MNHQAIITLNLARPLSEEEIWARLERLAQYYPACQVCRVVCESCQNCLVSHACGSCGDPEEGRGSFDVCGVAVSKDVVEGEDLYDAGRLLVSETTKYFEGSAAASVELRTIGGSVEGPEDIGWVVV